MGDGRAVRNASLSQPQTSAHVRRSSGARAEHHIMLVAMAATVAFGWIATGRRPWALTLVVAVDWFLINLMNRITDIDEDLRNGIPGTERVARRKRALTNPLAANGWAHVVPWSTIVALALFFVPFELTYEILYDMRDLEGDRAEGIPTYPVVHGLENARRIIDALLVASALTLVAAFVEKLVGVRELLMVVAPVVQLAFYRPRYRRGLTTRDCIVLTHIGTAELALFLVGTAAWLRAGMPPNVFL